MAGITRRGTLAAALAAPLARPALAQGTTIELWSFLDPAGRGVRSDEMAKLIRAFEADNAGVRVRTNVIQWTELGPQLLRASRAGQVPDVVMLYSPYMAPQVAAGTLLPIDDFMRGWSPAQQADIITMPIARDRQNQLYGLPWELRVFGLFWRVDLFERANLGPPATLDEMVAAGKRLQEGAVQGLGVSFNSATSTAAIEWFLPSVVALGGSILRDGLFLQRTPPVLTDPVYLPLITLATLLIALLHRRIADLPMVDRLVSTIDAVGTPAFAVVGMQKASAVGMSTLGVILVGLVNAVGGGVLRDVLVGREPLIFKPGTLNVIAALAGCGVYVALRNWTSLEETACASATIAITFVLRAVALRFNLHTEPVGGFSDEAEAR